MTGFLSENLVTRIFSTIYERVFGRRAGQIRGRLAGRPPNWGLPPPMPIFLFSALPGGPGPANRKPGAWRRGPCRLARQPVALRRPLPLPFSALPGEPDRANRKPAARRRGPCRLARQPPVASAKPCPLLPERRLGHPALRGHLYRHPRRLAVLLRPALLRRPVEALGRGPRRSRVPLSPDRSNRLSARWSHPSDTVARRALPVPSRSI